jgi:hypothetical protein
VNNTPKTPGSKLDVSSELASPAFGPSSLRATTRAGTHKRPHARVRERRASTTAQHDLASILLCCAHPWSQGAHNSRRLAQATFPTPRDSLVGPSIRIQTIAGARLSTFRHCDWYLVLGSRAGPPRLLTKPSCVLSSPAL